jgi:hypothetical protein
MKTIVNDDYGNSLIYQGGTVYLEGNPSGSAQQYYDQASQLAKAGKGDAAAGGDWKPLGVFALVQGSQADATQVLQLVVNGAGLIGGTFTNALTGAVLPVKGSADKQAQRAAWTVGDNASTFYEAGVFNLTQDTAPCLVHMGPGATQTWLLVRLPSPGGEQGSDN